MRRYEGSTRAYDIAVEENVGIRTRDGVRLAADIYRPALAGGPVNDRFPTIVERTPYGRTDTGLVLSARYFAAHGYNVLLQDCRGRYGSEGSFQHYWNPEGEDGYDTLLWVADQPWADGKVATMGLSYTGTNQQALAVTRPPGLVTQVICDTGLNFWAAHVRRAGALAQGIQLPWAFWMAATGHEASADPSVRSRLLDALEHIDQWLGREPLMRGESPLALAPGYEDFYLRIVNETDYGPTWATPMTNLEEFIDDYPEIPICLVTSWYGHHPAAAFTKWNRLRTKNPAVRVVCGTWIHGDPYMGHSWTGGVDFGRDAALNLDEFRLRWFDRWLKDMDSGIDTDPPIRIFVMGGGTGNRNADDRLDHGGYWREAAHWPLPEATFTALYLHAEGRLELHEPTETASATTYEYDPSDPVPTVGGSIQNPHNVADLIADGPRDQRCRRRLRFCRDDAPLADRPDILVFRTAPLSEPLEITGPVTAVLWVASSATDTDFTTRLIDEYPPSDDYPDGFAMNLTDGIVRMRYRGGRKAAEFIEPNLVYRVEVELPPTSNRFLEGHRIRVDISSSNVPQFDVNPNTGEPLGSWSGTIGATNSVFHDRDRPSHVLAPMVISPGDVDRSDGK